MSQLPSSADAEAITVARENASRFREYIRARTGGFYDATQVAEMLSYSTAAVETQRQKRQIFGVLYEEKNRYPAAQFANGEPLAGLSQILEDFGDTPPWEQLMFLTTPLEGFGERNDTFFDLLGRRPSSERMRQLVSLASSWVT